MEDLGSPDLSESRRINPVAEDSSTLTPQFFIEPLSAVADPTNDPCRIPNNQGVRWNVNGDDRSSSNKGLFAYVHSTHHDSACAEC
jgi:hypothetical protein